MSETKEFQATTQILWWNEELKSLWEPRIERIKKTYARTELGTVLIGMRRVYVYHIHSQTFEESYNFLRENNLVFYPVRKTGVYSGFSHKHPPVEKGKPFILYGAAVKNDDREAGELFLKYSTNKEKTNHKGIGNELLGYMNCCINFFDKVWSSISVDPMYEAALKTPKTKARDNTVEVSCHPYCNNMLRYFGIRITPHLTCSMQCKKTIKWGKEWFSIMQQLDSEAAEWTKELLSMPLTWSAYKGVAIIDTPIFRGITNSDKTLQRKIVKNTGWSKR